MESEEFDQKLCYKLIREQRTAEMKETEIITVDNREWAEQENIKMAGNNNSRPLQTHKIMLYLITTTILQST